VISKLVPRLHSHEREPVLGQAPGRLLGGDSRKLQLIDYSLVKYQGVELVVQDHTVTGRDELPPGPDIRRVQKTVHLNVGHIDTHGGVLQGIQLHPGDVIVHQPDEGAGAVVHLSSQVEPQTNKRELIVLAVTVVDVLHIVGVEPDVTGDVNRSDG